MKKVIKILGIILLAAIVIAGIVLFFMFKSKGPFSGTVKDTDGTPLTNVMVTDGKNVVKTDSDGKFTLKGYYNSHFVTVTLPAGYSSDDFYIPVEKGKESYDFNLGKDEGTLAENHSFIQISDTEVGKDGVGEWKDYLKEMADTENAAFLIHTGDICYEDGLKSHINAINTDTMGVPVKYIIGNHDYVDGKYGEALYESIYGPVWYSFDVGNIHYVVTPFQTGGDYKSGYNKDDRWRWLKNDLDNVDPDKKVVMFNHTTSPDENYVIKYGKNELDLKQRNLVAWIFGHYHYNYVTVANNGVLEISTARPDCGGIDQSASGARLISINKDGEITTKMTYYKSGAVENNDTAADLNWSAQLSENILFCDPIEQNGNTYIATVDDDYPHDCGVYCLDSVTGTVKWTYKTKNSVKNKLIFDDNKIYGQDCEGNVFCLNADNGNVIWQSSAQINKSLNTSSGICLDNGVLYAGSAADITAFSANSGEKVWTANVLPAECSAAEFVVSGNKLIVSAHWGSLTALDKTTGKQLWQNKSDSVRFRSSTPAVVDDNTLLVADDDLIVLINSETGEVINESKYEDYKFSVSSQPVIKDDIAYIGTANKGVVAYDSAKKEMLWNTETKPAIVYTAPYTSKDSKTVESGIVIDGEHLIFGASDGYIYTLNSSDGNIIKADYIGSPILGTPVVGSDYIISADFSGRVFKLAK